MTPAEEKLCLDDHPPDEIEKSLGPRPLLGRPADEWLDLVDG